MTTTPTQDSPAGDYAPIAIVGTAFRFPGDISDEASFWQALTEGRDLVTEIGPERWAKQELSHPNRQEPGCSITYAAGVLSDVAGFDAAFFGISPREAIWLDPQQRLLLELAWEATESAGIPASHLSGTKSAVFVGISSLDYGVRAVADMSSIASHFMTGNTLSIASNRLSYVFNLHGPSMSVDTACSSAMVALHQACNSLHQGEASLAFVGSVNLLLHPYPFVGFTKASMLSADGRCKAFDASANGYVRAEGGAVLILKPLAQAEADGDTIHAVIRGTGVNADGGRKTSLTIPSTDGQEELMRSVQRRAGIRPEAIDYVEAHGTGTAVGDPVETKAIAHSYGEGRDTPLPIGSVKTNMGHLESASGMAGIIKTLLMLKHDTLVPSRNCTTPNNNIPFQALNLQRVQEVSAITKPAGQSRLMAINSFGFGGSNAHAILESYQPKKTVAQDDTLGCVQDAAPPLFISAHSVAALRQLAGRYATQLESISSHDYYALAYNAAYHRDWLPHRLALAATTPGSMAEYLREYEHSGMAPVNASIVQAMQQDAPVAFVYTGNGAHWTQMAQALLSESPLFNRTLSEIDALVGRYGGFSVLEEILTESPRYDDTRIVQPVLFAIQAGVTVLLREVHGITPMAVAGHSVGEVAAVWAAGMLALEDAVALICARSNAQGSTRGSGRMAAVALSAEALQNVLAQPPYPAIEIAGYNSPSNSTISGPYEALKALEAQLNDQGVFFRMLDLDYAFHSAALDVAQSLFEQQLTHLPRRAGAIPFVSTVTGAQAGPEAIDISYWWDNIRKPVQFNAAIQQLAQLGARVFVEIGPHAILQRYISECLAVAKTEARVLPSLKRNDDGIAQLTRAAFQIMLSTKHPDCAAYFPYKAARMALPIYPWQHEHYWLPRTNESSSIIDRVRVHPLLGWRISIDEPYWENRIDLAQLGYLADHQVADAVVLPAAAGLEIALAAAQNWFNESVVAIEEFEIFEPIVLPKDQAWCLRTELNLRTSQIEIYHRERLSETAWSLHARCKLLSAPVAPAPKVSTHIVHLGGTSVTAADHYQLTEAVGLQYGPAFQALAHATIYEEHALDATLITPAPVAPDQAHYHLHPSLVDACFQSIVLFFRQAIAEGRGVQFLPVKIGKLRYYGGTATAFHATLTQTNPRSVCAAFTLTDAAGHAVAVLEECIFRMSAFAAQHKKTPEIWENICVPLTSAASNDALQPWMNQQLQRHMQAAHQQPSQLAYQETALPLLRGLVTAFAYEAFQSCAAEDSEFLQRVLSPLEAKPRYMQWLTQLLMDNGLLTHSANGAVLDTSYAPPLAASIWQTLLAEFPDALAELVLIGNIGAALPDLLMGRRDALYMARQTQKSYFFEHWYDDAAPVIPGNEALLNALERFTRTGLTHQALRVLFVSGGATSYAQRLAALCEAQGVTLVIAQPESERLSKLAAEYLSAKYVSVATLEEQTQTLSSDQKLPAQYDVIVLHHWVHRNPTAIQAFKPLLCPGGQLVLAETAPNYVSDFIFGLQPDWWHLQENNLVSSLLNAEDWTAFLQANGFGEITRVDQPQQHSPATSYMITATISEQPTVLSMANASRHWCLLTDSSAFSTSLAQQLATQLEAVGDDVVCVELERFIARDAAVGGVAPDQLVYLSQLGLSGQDRKTQPTRTHEVLRVVQALAAQVDTPKLWLVTSGGAPVAYPTEASIYHPEDAALWGLGRVIMNEYPQLCTTLIDVAAGMDHVALAAALTLVFSADSQESEYLVTSQGHYGVRAVSSQFSVADTRKKMSRFRLDFETPGQLRNLQWIPQSERALKEDEIEVSVAAVGLNFRDVMYTMGLLPDEAVQQGFSGPTLGLEFAGTITRVGKRVYDYAVGDAVMGFGAACFSSHVITHADAVIRKPDHWSFANAATVPTAFFTAFYALKHLAALQPGESVLIHGAAGGVGIAAIQIAKHLGAEVYVTAGTDEKRVFARLLGADHVYDSRSLAFADEILAHTDGQGVDVVLNSLAGEAINRNLRILKPFGRFLELGKRDFYENTYIGLRPFKSNISYHGIDADQLLVYKPRLAGKIFSELMALFNEGALSPLPFQSFAADRIVDAFRVMQQSRHIGKIVVDMTTASIPAAAAKLPEQLQVRRDATYVVSGGVSGFGAETAIWLAVQGAGHVVVLSRRGADAPEAAETLRAIESKGAHGLVLACDVSDRAQLAECFATLRKTLPPVRGIVHAAMVLDDALLKDLNVARMAQVWQPKADGAWNLHHESLTCDLDYFIVYSSITTLIGNPGQANYVAANAYLESLTRLRRSQSLPALCMCWGPIADSGYLTRNQAVKDSLIHRLGASPMETTQALASIPAAVQSGKPVVYVGDLAFGALARILPSASSTRFDVMRRQASGSIRATDTNLLAELMAMSLEEAQARIKEVLLIEAGKILSVSPERIDATLPLHDLGMDSLMLVELSLAIEQRFEVKLAAMEISAAGNSVDMISMRLAKKISHAGAEDAAEPSDRVAQMIETLMEQHATDLSDDTTQSVIDEIKQLSAKAS